MNSKYLIIFFLLIVTNYLSLAQDGQAIKIRAFEAACCLEGQNCDKVEWHRTNILIVITYSNEKIKIYSEGIQDFDILKDYDKTTDNDGDSWYRYEVVDQDGKKCDIYLYMYKKFNPDYRGGVLVKYKDHTFMYKYKIIE